LLAVLTVFAMIAVAAPAAASDHGHHDHGHGAQPAPEHLVINKGGTVDAFATGGSVGTSAHDLQDREVPASIGSGVSPLRVDPAAGTVVLPAGEGTPTAPGHEKGDRRHEKEDAKRVSNPKLVWSVEGVNHRDSRLAYGGHQFSGEPPDQALCAGNGYVLESVNSALRVFDKNGNPVSGVIALNELYGFPPAIDRTNAPDFTFPGPFTFDVSCHYDKASNRWFHLAVDLEQDFLTGNFTGRNYLDLAVSTSGDPRGSWNVYRIPGMNDGTEGTPNHHCPGGPCFADFPHIGVDANGVYISTNEFPFFGPGFNGAQVYAISKKALAKGASAIDVYLFDTSRREWRVAANQPGFTVWPALSPDGEFADTADGTEYFVSSNAVFDDRNGDSEEVIVWALTNTTSLDEHDHAPSLALTHTIVPSLRYAIPPPSVQKDGTIPLGEFLFLIDWIPSEPSGPGLIDTGDSRVTDVRYANGKLWAVLGTAANVNGEERAGVAWFILKPESEDHGVKAEMKMQGILALAGESLAYPTLGVTTSGRGVMGFTRVGESLYPSQGYASIDAKVGVGPVEMAAAGNAPEDGFTEYLTGRPRWGDYGAAAVAGKDVYLAGEYIEQGPCTVDELLSTDCGGTRTLLANWSTRLTKTRP